MVSHSSETKMTKLQMLKMLKDKVCQCTKCPELVASRKQIVFDNIDYENSDLNSQLAKGGNPNADLVFLGEAPGRTEDEIGKPFVGKAGQLLDVLISNIGLRREDVYILNVVKCHPDNNRAPYPEEAANCRPFLDLQLKVIHPRIIVCLGGVAAQNLLNTKDGVNRLRGSWYNYANAKVRVTFHPAYLLRNPKEKQQAWADFGVIAEEYRNGNRAKVPMLAPSIGAQTD